MEICPKCGLPEQACVCEDIVKSSQRIRITNDRKRYGKIVTVIEGFGKEIELKEIAKSLKNKLACGGTFEKSSKKIELQGEHKQKTKSALVELGFEEDSIDIE
jgi:translation initiation factor 1